MSLLPRFLREFFEDLIAACCELWSDPGESYGARDRTRYESHIWSPRTEDDEDDCLACGVTWSDCDDYCPGIAT